MHAHKCVPAVVEIVGSLAQVEIKDVDGIDLFDITVALAQRYVFGNSLGHTIEDALQIIELCSQLDFHYDDVTH